MRTLEAELNRHSASQAAQLKFKLAARFWMELETADLKNGFTTCNIQ